MRPSVYIETSIISALVDEREDIFTQAQRAITEEWWKLQAPAFDLFYGVAVLRELQNEEFPRQKEAIQLLDQLNFLESSDEADGIATIYQSHLVMPQGAFGDAVHLATASIYEMNYLLTWNCRHLANTNKIQHIRTINYRLGLVTPDLLTPQMLVAPKETPDERD